VRPLLPYRRDDLARYVEASGLPVWHDPSNHDRSHLRSWLRADLLPTLRNRIPDADARLARVGALAGKNRRAWDLALEQLRGLDFTLDENGISIAANCLRAYDSTLAETVLMAVARRGGCPLGPVRAGRVLGLLEGASGRMVPLAGGWRAELAFDRLRLLPPTASEPARLELQGAQGVGEWGGWHLRWKTEPAPERQPREALTAWFQPEPLQVRAWVPGDRVRPLAGAGRRLVVRCFQDARVPRSRRDRWPVITGADSVVWVPGVCRSDALLPSPGAEALRVDAQHA
jgi:tRNA(Ile)-lysidine synthetase-like protein